MRTLAGRAVEQFVQPSVGQGEMSAILLSQVLCWTVMRRVCEASWSEYSRRVKGAVLGESIRGHHFLLTYRNTCLAHKNRFLGVKRGE